MILEWRDPPPRARPAWCERALGELKQHPGRWALIAGTASVSQAKARAQTLRRAAACAELELETATRREGTEYTVYARALGI